VVGDIDAVNDDFSATPIASVLGGNTATVFTNDTLNNAAFASGAVVPTIILDGGLTGVTINADGTLTVPANTPPNTYTVTYQICEAVNLGNCDTAEAIVVVNNSINAVDDDFSTNIINEVTGGVTPSVFANDTLNANSFVDADVIPSIVINGGITGLTINPDGSLNVPPNTPAATYNVTYQICDVANPTVCDTAVAIVEVVANLATVTVNDAIVNEGGDLVFTVVVDNAIGTPFDVVLSCVDDTAVGGPASGLGIDFNNTPQTASFSGLVAGESFVITIPSFIDSLDELDETFVLNLTASSVLVNDSDTGLATILNVAVDTDGDGPPDVDEGPGDRDGDGIPNAEDFDPLGYFYCEDTGQIVTGGSVSFTSPVGGSSNLLLDGSTGQYQAFFTPPAAGGVFGMSINVPPGTALSTARLQEVLPFNTPAGPAPVVLGGGQVAATGFLNDFSAATNTPWFTSFDVEPGDAFILNNNIPLTNCATLTNSLLLTKTATPSEVIIGNVVQYTLRVENASTAIFNGLSIIDNIPAGFNFADDSAFIVTAGPDGELDTGDDVESAIVVSGSDPIVFENIDIVAEQAILIRYLLRVSSGVVEGNYVNTAQVVGVGGNLISNEASATVRVVQDPILQRTTIIGKVFNDRDGDGWQDSAHATKVKIKSEHFGEQGHELGTIYGRGSEFDSVLDYQVVVRMPLNLQGDNGFVVESAEGTVIEVNNDGDIRFDHKREKRKGLTAQELVVASEREKDDLLITITNHGIQEAGIPGARLATVEGLIVETDQYGRYHLANIDGGRFERGRNFIIKVDPATLPEGSVFTTENPRVLRITQGLLSKFNFGVKLPEQDIELTDGQYGVAKRVEREIEVVEKREIKDVIEPVYFNSGKAQITDSEIHALEQEISKLKNKENVVVRVVGHADSQRLSTRARAEYVDNYGLAQARAEQVAEILRDKLNLRGDKVQAVGHGANQPLESNETEQGRAKNRRTEINIVYDERYLKTVTEVDYTPTTNPARKSEAKIPNGGAIWAVEDPVINDPRLNVVAQGGITLKDGKVKDLVKFTLFSNYHAFIDRWELAIYASNDRDLIKPIDVISGSKFVFADPIEWDAQAINTKYFKEGESLSYVLRVFDKQGRMDETTPLSLTVTDERLIKFERRDIEEDEQDVALASFGESSLLRQTIPIKGSRVRVNGVNLDSDYTITVNGEQATVDEEGKFVFEQHLPIGTHELLVNVSNGDEIDFDRTLSVDVTGKYLFLVGLANVTVGKNNVSGNVEALGEDDHFDGDVWVDGRVAFYLKGKIKGKYLITAQLDTTEDEISNLGNRLEEEDPTEVFRRLDPDEFYAVYGDDSTTIDDTDSQGAFYLRVDWDKSSALWGNYNTNLSGTEFAQYNRSLYGAKIEHRNVKTTKFGENQHEVQVFASEAQTASAQNEFLATGGSLYFLRNTDVVQGSEQVRVEVRRRDTEQVVESIVLEHGRDFDIDYFQGRIILTRPLTQVEVGSGPSIIRDTALEGNDVFLLVDYEFRPDAFSADDITTGGRARAWLNDYIAIGGTYVTEERDGTDYELKGTDLTLRAGKGTYLRFEYAESDANQAANNELSLNGGLTFTSQNSSSDNIDGEAKGVEARINFAELSDQEGFVLAWWKDRDAGFSSTARLGDGVETLDTGIEGEWQASDKFRLSARASKLDQEGQSEFNAISVQGNYEVNEKLNIGTELRYEDEEDELLARDGEALLAGAEVRYKLNEQTEVYASGQTVVSESDDFEDNDLGTVGVEQQVSDRLALRGEVSVGDRGDAVVLGAEYSVTPNLNISVDAGFGSGATPRVGTNYTTANGFELYGSYAVDPDRTDGDESIFTFGSRKRYGNGLSLYSENQFGQGDVQQSAARTYGLDFDVSDQWRLSASLQTNDIEDNLGDIDRRAATIGASFSGDTLKFGSVLEYREDKNQQTDEDATQWVNTNTIEWQQSESLRWLGRVDVSTTQSDANNNDEARFAEIDLGFAYRPAFNDKLNILGNYTFLYDLASSGQDTSFADQRSHVFALEGIYDVSQKWEVGAKLAYRTGDVRVLRGEGPWIETGAHLAVTRARYHLLKKWDALIEYRWLETEGEDDARQGALVGLYRHVGQSLKVGAGYNFTDFSDDLTDNDYESNGWFFDITGKY